MIQQYKYYTDYVWADEHIYAELPRVHNRTIMLAFCFCAGFPAAASSAHANWSGTKLRVGWKTIPDPA